MASSQVVLKSDANVTLDETNRPSVKAGDEFQFSRYLCTVEGEVGDETGKTEEVRVQTNDVEVQVCTLMVKWSLLEEAEVGAFACN